MTIRHAVAATLLLALPALMPAQPAKTVAPPATVATIDAEGALTTLKKLIDAPVPAGMSEKDRAEYVTHTAWIKSAYDRVITAREASSGMATGRVAQTGVKAPRDVATGQSSGKRQHGVSAADIVRLQSTFETESRKFQTLSNASKARHDIAMNAIRNMK
jgi:hypothetical protein